MGGFTTFLCFLIQAKKDQNIDHVTKALPNLRQKEIKIGKIYVGLGRYANIKFHIYFGLIAVILRKQ